MDDQGMSITLFLPLFPDATNRRVWSEKVPWLTGDRLDIHVAIETHNNTELKRVLKSGLCDPSINCCKLYVFQSPHLTVLREVLPSELENVAPLHLAVIVDNHDAVKLLLRPCHEMRTPVSVNQRIRTCHSTALHLAVLLKRGNMIPDLVGSGADLVTLKDSFGFTAFELAVHLQPDLVSLLYRQFYACRTNKHSFLYDYLSVKVDVKVASILLQLGDNHHFEEGGESIFQHFLRTYDKSNIIEVARFFLEHVDLEHEERRMREDRVGDARRAFPALFQPGPVYGRVRRSTLNCRKRYNSLAVVMIHCKRPSSDRVQLMQLLLDAGSQVTHRSKNDRSLLHLCAKSRHSNVEEAEFLIEKGVPITWTDFRQAIKKSRYDLLDLFLARANPAQLNLQFYMKHAMSMLAMKSSRASIVSYSTRFFVPESHVLIRFFDQMMEYHSLDPMNDGNFYPLPLLHILILKNKIYTGLYAEAIEFVASHPLTDLQSTTFLHGTPITYARSLKQFDVMNILIEKDEEKYEERHKIRDRSVSMPQQAMPCASGCMTYSDDSASIKSQDMGKCCNSHCCRHVKKKRVSFSGNTKFCDYEVRDDSEPGVESEEYDDVFVVIGRDSDSSSVSRLIQNSPDVAISIEHHVP